MLGDSKTYEIAFLLKDPEAEKAVSDLISQYSGNIANKSQTRSIKLSYPIKKAASAYFGYIQFELLPENLEKLSQALRLNQSVLRFLAVEWSPAKKVFERKSGGRKSFPRPAEAAPKTVLTNEVLEEKLAALEGDK